MLKLKVMSNGRVLVSGSKEAKRMIRRSLSIDNKEKLDIEKRFYSLQSMLRKKTLEYASPELADDDPNVIQLQKEVRRFQHILDSMPDRISFYRDFQGTKFFMKGFLPRVKVLLMKNNIPFKVSYLHSEKINLDPKNFTRDYQYLAVRKFLIEKSGIIKVPTGGGKTIISRIIVENILFHIQGIVIFFVEQKDLIDQTLEKFEPLKEYDIKCGLIGDNRFDIRGARVIVATIQSFTSLLKSRNKLKNDIAKSLIEKTEAIVVDECDLFSTTRRLSALDRFKKLKYKLYLSGTPYSKFKPTQKFRLMEATGGVIYTITEQELIEKGFLTKQVCFMIYNISHLVQNRKMGWELLYNSYIVNNLHRNKLIADVQKVLKEFKLATLFVLERKTHGEVLLRTMNDKSVVYRDGDSSTYDRQDAVKRMIGGELSGIISTRIFRRALDIPALDCFVNGAGYKSDSYTIQGKGRITRTASGKNVAFYIDFYDYGHDKLEDHSLERKSALEEAGHEVHVIYIQQLRDAVKKVLSES